MELLMWVPDGVSIATNRRIISNTKFEWIDEKSLWFKQKQNILMDYYSAYG